MSDSYEYEDKPFTIAIAERSLNLQYEKKLNIKSEGEALLKYHLDNGGLPPESDGNLEGEDLLYHIISTAMRHLKSDGRANMIEGSSQWEIFPEGRRVFGIGSESVYCFYNPRDRREAEERGERLWECNIGKTTRPVKVRVREQTYQWTVDPRIDLILKTSPGSDLEKKIHRILKLLGRHIPGFRGSGREWYLVSPDEVVYLYKCVITRFENELKEKG